MGRGLLPGWATGLALSVEAEPPNIWPLRLAAAYWPGTDARGRGTDVDAPVVRFAMAQASFAVCPLRTGAAPFTLQACAGLLLTHHWTERIGLEMPTRARGLALCPLLGVQGAYALSRHMVLHLS